MKLTCLTVKQPWASLIFGCAGLLKDVENRSWFPSVSITEVWIHAGQSWDKPGAEWIAAEFGVHFYRADFPKGYILGKVEIDQIVKNYPSRWAQLGQWHWVFKNPQTLKQPISAKGHLGLWIFYPETEPQFDPIPASNSQE